MGKLFYGATTHPIEIDDRVLAHLSVVVSTKLRRSESFTLTYPHTENGVAGRSTIWLQPSIPLRFTFDQAEPHKLDQRILQDMATDAASSRGLVLDLEVEAAATAPVPLREAA